MSGVADQFSDKQITEFKEAFSLFDDNKDGTVFMAQIDFVMKALGIHGNEMELRVSISGLILCTTHSLSQKLMMEVDSDESGTIDFPEFLSLMSKVNL